MTDNDKKDDVALQIKKPSLGGDDKTAKIPKLQKPGTPGSQKVVMNAASNSSIKPSDVTKVSPAASPGVEETIHMDKSEIKDIPEIAGLQNAGNDATQKTLKPPAPISKTAKSKTIKLKPLKPINATEDNQEETLSMDRNALIDEEMPSLGAPAAPAAPAATPDDPGLDDEATIKIKKPAIKQPTAQAPAIPGSKETIKLRPSSAAPASAKSEDNMATVSMSKKTIRLVPKQPNASNDATQVAAKPSAPTVKLGAPPPAPAAAAPAAPSAPTVKMPEPAPAPAAAAPAEAPTSSKRTLKLKPNTPKPPEPAPTATGEAAPEATVADTNAPMESEEVTEKVKGADPSIVMTLVALITLILMAYCTWVTFGSWSAITG